MDKSIGFGIYQRAGRVLDVYLCLGYGGVGGEWVWSLEGIYVLC